MHRETLELRNVGPIQRAELVLGDLTVLVGPQATGKSVALQFLKLFLDNGPIVMALRKSGLDWDEDVTQFLDVYLGEGMRSGWSESSVVRWQGDAVDLREWIKPRRGKSAEKCFFIPAQRVLTLSREGWLRPFSEYRAGDPFTVRDFSEKLRILMDQGFGGKEVFPQPGRLKKEIRRMLSETVFGGFQLEVEKHGAQKRLVLAERGASAAQRSSFSQNLPFMVWSAGQREFVPLLLGLYWLMPPTKSSRRGALRWVIIEELEMGLHPRAIETMLVIVLDLLARGYRVCLSTHSTHVLDLVWAMQVFRSKKASARSVLDLFGVKKTQDMTLLAEKALKKDLRVYFFDQSTKGTRDISSLDPSSALEGEAGWGGLTDFSARVQEEVARVIARSGE